MRNRYLVKGLKNEKGSLIIEATIVFPVTFLVIFLLLFLGNIYYQRSKAQAVMTREAIEAAAAYSNPMAEYYVLHDAIPACNADNDFKPYRYLGSGGVETTVKENIVEAVEGMGTGLFSSMDANDVYVEVDYKCFGVYATSQVYLKYSLAMPIKMLGQDEPYKIVFEEYVEISAMEGSEIVRNVTMIVDIFETFGVSLSFEEYIGQSDSPVSKFFDFIN